VTNTYVPQLPDELVRRAARRRKGLEVFGSIDAQRTALLAINMQNAWLMPDAPFDADHAAASVLPQVNRIAHTLRSRGGLVIWLQTTTGAPGTPSYWSTYFDNFVGDEKRPEAVAALLQESPLHALYHGIDRQPEDLVLPKYRFSAFAHNPHDLDALLRSRGIDTIVVAGTATNICCESTVRDAMMRDFRTFMPHDGVAAPSREAHETGLRSVAQVFADIRGLDAILPLIKGAGRMES
jgi:ureidoacrylate peracid hydrolase